MWGIIQEREDEQVQWYCDLCTQGAMGTTAASQQAMHGPGAFTRSGAEEVLARMGMAGIMFIQSPEWFCLKCILITCLHSVGYLEKGGRRLVWPWEEPGNLGSLLGGSGHDRKEEPQDPREEKKSDSRKWNWILFDSHRAVCMCSRYIELRIPGCSSYARNMYVWRALWYGSQFEMRTIHMREKSVASWALAQWLTLCDSNLTYWQGDTQTEVVTLQKVKGRTENSNSGCLGFKTATANNGAALSLLLWGRNCLRGKRLAIMSSSFVYIYPWT